MLKLIQQIGGVILVGFFIFSSLPPLPAAHAMTDADKFVRTANYFLLSGPALDRAIDQLAQFDLLVIPTEAQLYNQNFFTEIRRRNPDILIFAYVPSVSWNNIWNSKVYQTLKAGIDPSWWLRDKDGNQISIWPNTSALDLTTGWSTYLADWTVDTILASEIWNGVFYDEVSAEINWIPDLTVSDVDWTKGVQNLFSRTRSRAPTALILMNGSSHDGLIPLVNGRMYESFPTPWESNGNWSTLISRYLNQQKKSLSPPIFILQSDTNNTGNKNDYQRVRFGITSTLLGNGYFGFDYGTQSHGQTWIYDEYSANLGLPKTDATDNGNGIWERDFTQGKVLVNANASAQTFRLDGEYEKLHGSQEPNVNDGSIVSSVTLNGRDGLILLRPIDRLLDAVFLNGSFVRVFSLDGKVKRTGFFAYEDKERGGSRLITTDVNGDGVRETVVADQTFVTISGSDGAQLTRFAPYGEKYKIGVNIAVGDTDGDGKKEIVTGTSKGGGPHVKVYHADGGLVGEFFAYDAKFSGGVRVALGDLNGDGMDEVIVGAGSGGGPHVRIFRADGKLLSAGFFAYDKKFRGGVFVSAGDVDGDGVDEIVTGPGIGGGPHVRVFTKDGKLKAQFFTFNAKDNKGAEVLATDVDGDGIAEIIGLTTDVFTLSSF